MRQHTLVEGIDLVDGDIDTVPAIIEGTYGIVVDALVQVEAVLRNVGVILQLGACPCQELLHVLLSLQLRLQGRTAVAHLIGPYHEIDCMVDAVFSIVDVPVLVALHDHAGRTLRPDVRHEIDQTHVGVGHKHTFVARPVARHMLHLHIVRCPLFYYVIKRHGYFFLIRLKPLY